MTKAIPEDAEKFLADVKPIEAFWFNNGPIARNLHEVANTLAVISDNAFLHHVNDDKNDIANWVKDVLCDEEFSKNIRGIKSRQKMLSAIKSRIAELEKIIDKDRNSKLIILSS